MLLYGVFSLFPGCDEEPQFGCGSRHEFMTLAELSSHRRAVIATKSKKTLGDYVGVPGPSSSAFIEVSAATMNTFDLAELVEEDANAF